MKLKHLFNALLMAPVLALSAVAHAQGHSDKEAQADAKRHRAMAVAHQSAAECLESGKKTHEQCRQELQTACKGLAIGKFCGMKHQH